MKPNALQRFLVIVLLLFLIRLILPSMVVPVGIASALSIVLTIVFVAVPILALYAAAAHVWSAKLSATFLASGVALHAVSYFLMRSSGKEGFLPALFDASAQTGLLIWCVGLGSLITAVVKDKNLIPPMAVFLAGFDMYIIFKPTTLPRQIIENAPEVFHAVAAKVPTVLPSGTGGMTVGPGTYIGPADFIFLAMFFVALFKFQMRTRETLLWIMPVLVLYLALVLFGSGLSIGPISLAALPALLPIGLTVLLVNWKQFAMNQEEKLGMALATILAVSRAAFGIYSAAKAKKNPVAPPVASPASE